MTTEFALSGFSLELLSCIGISVKIGSSTQASQEVRVSNWTFQNTVISRPSPHAWGLDIYIDRLGEHSRPLSFSVLGPPHSRLTQPEYFQSSPQHGLSISWVIFRGIYGPLPFLAPLVPSDFRPVSNYTAEETEYALVAQCRKPLLDTQHIDDWAICFLLGLWNSERSSEGRHFKSVDSLLIFHFGGPILWLEPGLSFILFVIALSFLMIASFVRTHLASIILLRISAVEFPSFSTAEPRYKKLSIFSNFCNAVPCRSWWTCISHSNNLKSYTSIELET